MKTLLALLVLLLPVAALAADEPDAARLVAEHAAISAKRQGLIEDMRANVAQKRAIEKEYAAVDADTEQYRRDVSEATAFCTGRFDDEEYRRRKAICEQKQRELDERHGRIEARRADIDRRDKARQAAAVKLKTEYDALGRRAQEIESSISAASPYAGVAERCRKEQKGTAAIDACIDRGWKEAADEVRDYLDLETGRAFTQGADWRRQIDAMPWPLQDKMEATVAVFLAEIGRYGDAAQLMGGVRARKPGDTFLDTAGATLDGLARRTSGAAGPIAGARGIADELKIAHLSSAAQADVMLGILQFREGNYAASLSMFGDARRRHPADAGLRDLSFLVGQAAAALDQPPPPTRAARRMQQDGALAASGLAIFLVQTGDTAKAELALDAARERLGNTFKTTPDPAIGGLIRDVERVSALVRDEGTAKLARPAGQRFFDKRSKADLMLDALSYGQKSWSASLRYLEIARAADPGNARIRQAYDELAAIARQASSR
ncbi:MAG: hypothetical protein JSR90_18255 [Proteobacteria bacterium]|nr:hypothetical protein [Pseudomonadota bacterium]